MSSFNNPLPEDFWDDDPFNERYTSDSSDFIGSSIGPSESDFLPISNQHSTNTTNQEILRLANKIPAYRKLDKSKKEELNHALFHANFARINEVTAQLVVDHDPSKYLDEFKSQSRDIINSISYSTRDLDKESIIALFEVLATGAFVEHDISSPYLRMYFMFIEKSLIKGKFDYRPSEDLSSVVDCAIIATLENPNYDFREYVFSDIYRDYIGQDLVNSPSVKKTVAERFNQSFLYLIADEDLEENFKRSIFGLFPSSSYSSKQVVDNLETFFLSMFASEDFRDLTKYATGEESQRLAKYVENILKLIQLTNSRQILQSEDFLGSLNSLVCEAFQEGRAYNATILSRLYPRASNKLEKIALEAENLEEVSIAAENYINTLLTTENWRFSDYLDFSYILDTFCREEYRNGFDFYFELRAAIKDLAENGLHLSLNDKLRKMLVLVSSAGDSWVNELLNNAEIKASLENFIQKAIAVLEVQKLEGSNTSREIEFLKLVSEKLHLEEVFLTAYKTTNTMESIFLGIEIDRAFKSKRLSSHFLQQAFKDLILEYGRGNLEEANTIFISIFSNSHYFLDGDRKPLERFLSLLPNVMNKNPKERYDQSILNFEELLTESKEVFKYVDVFLEMLCIDALEAGFSHISDQLISIIKIRKQLQNLHYDYGSMARKKISEQYKNLVLVEYDDNKLNEYLKSLCRVDLMED